MAAKNETAGESSGPEFVITRVFDAPRELVFKAWTDPKQMAQWWGPKSFTTPVCQMDVRPGGAYRIVMRSVDGVEYPITGVFRQIVEPERIVMTQDVSEHPGEWHDLVKPNRSKEDKNPAGELFTTVTFEDQEGKTRLTVRTRFESAAIRDAMLKMGMTEGWSQSLERLEELMATANTSDREIKITRIFDAPRELVWEAMTNPRHVIHWWGPRGFTMTIEEMDVRPGGVWNHVMHGPDGTDYPNRSVFTEIVKPERIVFSNGGGKKGAPEVQFVSTWTFDTVDDGKTQVTIHMVFPTAAQRDTVVKEYGAIEGGKQTLARLAEQLAKMPVVVERTFGAPVEIVWKAITEIDQMKRWFFETLTSFKPEVGFQTQFEAGAEGKNYLHLLKVTEVIPGKKIAYRWKYEGFPGESFVTFELFAEGRKTKLKLTHEGLETFLPESNPIMVRGNFVKGWTHIVGLSLKEFLETTGDTHR